MLTESAFTCGGPGLGIKSVSPAPEALEPTLHEGPEVSAVPLGPKASTTVFASSAPVGAVGTRALEAHGEGGGEHCVWS